MNLLELALLHNKSGFVELLMEHVELKDFLTTERLKNLYEKVNFPKLFQDVYNCILARIFLNIILREIWLKLIMDLYIF